MTKAQWIKENLKGGEQYAGILLGKDGAPDQHVILIAGEAENVTWQQAKAFAKKSGGDLPTRREQSLLIANLKEQFQPRWYWSSEQHAAGSYFAWAQDFDTGYQYYLNISHELRARAVRRLEIQ